MTEANYSLLVVNRFTKVLRIKKILETTFFLAFNENNKS